MKNLFCSLKKNGKQIIALFAMVCFIIGNAAFIPAVEANAATGTIKKVVNPADFYVDNGTREVTLQKLLPKQVDVVMSNGTKSKADVTWNTKGYVSNVKSSHIFNFTGTVKGTKLTAKIKVILANPFVTSIKTPEPIRVANGTTVDKLNLPKTVTVVKSDKTTASAKVVWDTSKYNGKVLRETEYVFTGDVEGTEKNTTITVKVAAPSIASIVAPEPITVANGTSLAQLKVKLPAGVLVYLSNGALSGVDVTWDTSSYDGNVSKETTYTFKGVLEGTNLTTSIDVKVGGPSIINVMQPSSITVYTGTSLSSLENMLPKTVKVFMSNFVIENTKVTWDTSAYDPTSTAAKSYVVTGTVEGSTKTVTINVYTLSVSVAAPYILSVTAPQPMNVYYGTPVDKLDLPKTVKATWSNGVTNSVAVVWDTTSYNGNVEEGATYTFIGRVPGTTITTSIKVIVPALWTLVWSDEFDKSGTNLDTNGLDLDKWGYQIGTGAEYGLDGWGNNEQEYYTKNNIEIKNDTLIITPKMEGVGGKPYTSGRIWTSPTYAKKYGKIEARIKMPVGQGFWPAFWMMPKNDVYGGWASSGELDIMEAIGHQPGHVNGTIHFGGSWPNNKYAGGTHHFEEGTGIGDYHTYAVEWEPGEIRWLVDGVVYHTQNNWYTNGSDGDEKYAFPAPFDQEFYIILNLAVGGNYVGNVVPGAEEFEDNPAMEVDYVRVYELTGRPYKTPVEPRLEVEELPAGARPHHDEEGNPLNLVYDTNFENGIKDNAEGIDADFGDGWNFVHNAQFGGQATVKVEEIDGRNFAKVDVTNAGNQNYSVQLEQHTTLGKGRWYEFSFDAKADKNRTIVTKLGGGSTVGWAAYSDSYTINLTTEVQSFKKVFQMTKDSDILTRIEFNCATTTGPVWIGNVKLVEVDPPSVDPNKSKDPLLNSGNHVYNGAFDKYTIDRLAYWTLNKSGNADAAMFVPEATRELNVNIIKGGNAAEDITVEQGAIQLTKNSDYLLTFKAKAAADRTAKVKLTSKDGATSFAEKEVNLTTSYETFRLSFTMGDITDLESNLVFMLGGNESTVFLDDVKLIKTSIDYTGVDLYPLKNGDFAHGITGWEQFTQGANANFAVDNGAAKISATTLGSEAWNIMLMQGGMSIKRGIEYTFSFKAKSSVSRDILVTMENASYARAFDSGSIQLTNYWQTFTYTIKPAVDDVVTLKYQLGKTAAAAEGDIYIDDVVFQVKNPPYKQAPMLVADTADNRVGNVVDITFIDNAEWREAITAIKVNGSTLATDKYTVSAENISFITGIFSTAGSYIITVEADGYVAATVTQTILPNDGNLVINGDMTNGKVSWSIWSHDNSSNFEIKDGAAEITINSISSENWSTQFYQEGIQLAAGKTYELSFRAWSTVNRPIRVEYTYIGGDRLFNITSDKTVGYTATITPAADGRLKLNFCIGNVTNGSETTPNVVHKIYIDDVQVKEVTGGEPIIDLKDTNIVAHGVNLVDNGDFTTDTAGWEHWWGDQWAGFANGTVNAEDGKMKISLTSIGSAAYSPQVFQQGIHLENGKTYVVSFKARAGVARKMNVNIGKALTADPWFINYA
ncbi:carbohydrate binding domain-containing protein, partial [Clostridium thermarum]|uniref:carbohydrate binding domain-containing protein n=1 Tax=Clostridium thermarum TaxID=1716543 RepID=UPI0013D3EA6D